MTDSRNFRASYFKKVGIKGVEEKKSLEIILKEQLLDVSKLSQFFLRFPIPASYRIFLWKVLLEVVPAYQEAHEFVIKQRQIQYNDMHEALQVMGRIDENTPLSEVHLRMYLMDGGILPFEESKMFQDKDNQAYLAMASSVAEIADDAIDVYWITAKFYSLQAKYRSAWPIMAERVEHYIKKEDGDGHLHTHLQSLRAFAAIPFTTWFHTCYSGILPENCIERIWDKIIGGSCQILQFVAVSVLLTLKRPLLSMKSTEDILKYLTKVPEDFGDRIVSNALDLWQKYGSLLVPSVHKPESPANVDRKS